MDTCAPVIRRYRSVDHAGLMAFLNIVFTQMGRRFVPDGKDADVRDLEAVYLQGRGAFHIVELDGQIHGSVGVRPFAPDIAELKRLYLGRNLRGQGLGEALCRLAVEDARQLGYRLLRLDTASESVEALGLFRKLGFREIEKYDDNPYVGLYFEKTL